MTTIKKKIFIYTAAVIFVAALISATVWCIKTRNDGLKPVVVTEIPVPAV